MVPNIGDIFVGKYRIDGVLGEGGFGAVYAAEELALGRPVALKVLKPDQGDGYATDTRARFTREARLVGSIQHPHVVAMLDFGDAQGLLYMAFEVVPGEDLNALIDARGRLEPAEATHILRQLLDALGAAHGRGLLHRDLKPQNVRVFRWGDDPLYVKLLDFGLARPTADGSPGITATGELVGTPRYMSPEQLTSQPLTPASDIYSLGILFLEMLVGSAPLQGNRWTDQFDRLMSGHVFSIPELERLGPALVDLVQRMTARDPAKRFGSTTAVLRALDRIQAGPTPPSPPARRAPIASPPPARTGPPRQTLVAGVVALALLIPLLGLLRREPSPAVPSDARRETIIAPQTPTAPVDAAATRRPNAGVAAPSPRPTASATHGSAGCGKDGWSGWDSFEELHIYTPAGYQADVPHPVVLFLPRDPSRALVKAGGRRDYTASTRLDELADRHGFVVVVPRGSHRWGAQHEDVEPVLADLELAEDWLCLDRSRVFVIADHRGARAAFPLSCQDWVTGVAVYAYIHGTNWDDPTIWCAEVPKPMIYLSPTTSRVVPIDGPSSCNDNEIRPLEQLEQDWRTRNRCRDEPVQVRPGCTAWPGQAPFWSCRFEGGYHWPGVPDLSSLKCPEEGPVATFPIEETIWEFFSGLPPLELPGD